MKDTMITEFVEISLPETTTVEQFTEFKSVIGSFGVTFFQQVRKW